MILAYDFNHDSPSSKEQDKSIDWFPWNQDNVSELSDMFTCDLLFQWASYRKNPITHIGLVQNKHHHHFMECKLFLSWYSWKVAHLALKNNHSLSKVSTEDKGLTTPWVLHIHWTMTNPPCKTQQRHKSFFPHMISDMNQLPWPIVMTFSVEIFKALWNM